MQIIVRVTNVYGKQTVYPVCDTAQKLSALTGNKTFTQAHLITIKSLGYEIQVAPQTLEVT